MSTTTITATHKKKTKTPSSHSKTEVGKRTGKRKNAPTNDENVHIETNVPEAKKVKKADKGKGKAKEEEVPEPKATPSKEVKKDNTKAKSVSEVAVKPTPEKKRKAEAPEVESPKKAKKSKKAAVPLPKTSNDEDDAEGSKSKLVVEAGDEDEHEAASSDEEEDDVHLKGFSSDSGSDSSDEEDLDSVPPIDIGKLPTIAKDDATVKKKLDKAKKQATAERGVLYIGCIPHGFYEDEMKGYFSQFGDVTRLRLSRNKRTGKSKHYAFIEFASSAVAQIVQETMDNYLLMGHILKCKIVPKEEVHPKLWIGANRKYRAVPIARKARQEHNRARTDDEKKAVEKRLKKREAQKKRKLQEAGIDYDFGSASYVKKS